MNTADRVVLHDMGKSPIKKVTPTVSGGQLVEEYGYVSRLHGFILMCLADEIEDTIAGAESQSGYVREGQWRETFTINPQLQFYDVEFNLVLYSAS